MTETLTPYAVADVILTIRGHKVILDRDLAMLYSAEVKRLSEQVKRNRDRFPDDFAFQLTLQEVTHLKSHFATSSSPGMRSQIATASAQRSRSQFATLKRGHNCSCRLRNPPRRRSASVSARRDQDTPRRPVRRSNHDQPPPTDRGLVLLGQTPHRQWEDRPPS